MGKLQTFEILFDQNKTMYSSGEPVTGSVKVDLSSSMLCKAIKINCCGFCGVTNKVNDTSWNVEEQYFNSTISVADKGTLKQGKHVFPFKFLLPASCPTSFEGKYGRIIYRVRAIIDTPRFVTDYNTEKFFYLLNLLNLNELPDIWGKSSSAVTKEFTYMLMKSGTVVLKAQTDMKGYTPGQIIQVMANISNQSGKSTGHMAASLVQQVSYGLKKPVHDIRTIAEVEGGVVKPGKEVEWKEQIIVPPLPQSSLAGCELIKIDYYVKVSLKFPDVQLTLPIHIGNVSLDKKLQPSSKAAPLVPSSASSGEPLPSLPTPDITSSSCTPTCPPEPTPILPFPRPLPRVRLSSHTCPSAPPAEYQNGAEGGPPFDERFPNKRQSQLVSPSAFSYVPGLVFPNNPSGSITPSSMFSASAPHITDGASSTPVPPPRYSAVSSPQEAPPSYDESCSN
ncbi:arrestin domain-containing protein 1a [Takifugu flavidus]|uniref:arrestin domain-containing protein 1a n=1 Tax=Takifugu flavidus TaxID=433684 RepID=UPI0025445152|nr:arrestin domain-containing protein 1a [Takifugu flavidus]